MIKITNDFGNVLLALAIVEFISTFSAAIFMCHFTRSNGNSCCADLQQGNKSEIEENSIAACMWPGAPG